MAEEDDVDIGCDSIRNWSELGIELLELILKRLALVDIVRFKLVSSSWNKAAKSYISNPVNKSLVPQAPWLLLPREHSDVDGGRFFSLSEQKIYTLRNLFEGFGEHERCLIGSSYGWLVLWDSNVYIVHLLNPISRVRIILPPLGLDHLFIRSVFLSSDPSYNKTYVVITYKDKDNTKIAFHKHGDDGNNTSWTELDGVAGGVSYQIILHNSLLYGMCLDSKSISVWDFGATYTIKTMDLQPPKREEEQRNSGRYLVESQGEILLVERLGNPISGQIYYDIHKLNFTANKVECLKVQCLQARALVLSGWTSISASTMDIPELETNSIYVAKGRFSLEAPQEVYTNVEEYNLENKDFKSIFTSQGHRCIPHSTLLWIVPNPCM